MVIPAAQVKALRDKTGAGFMDCKAALAEADLALLSRDVVRFMMLTRKNDSQMEFDLEKALEQSRDNPVFYVHYAHARCRSVLRSAAEDWGEEKITPAALTEADLSLLSRDCSSAFSRSNSIWLSFLRVSIMNRTTS